MLRIAISGSYGGTNLGDEAILQSIVTQLRARVSAEITVFTLDAGDTMLRHDVDHAIVTVDLTREELSAEVQNYDFMILGGGGVLFDYWVEQHLREASLALDAGVPLFVHSVGAGPLIDSAARESVADCLGRADIVTVRDTGSLRTLERLGVRRDIVVTADPALLLEPEPLPEGAFEREGLDPTRPLIGMSVREPGPAAPDIDVDHYHIQLASAADYMVDRFNARIVFVPMEPKLHDVQHSHAVISKMYRAQHASVLKGSYSSGELLTFMQHFSFAVGMRLHFLIFAALRRIPFVALPYAPKVNGFLEELNMDTPPIEGLTIGRLLAYIDSMWDRQDELRARMNDGVPVLQDRARQTADDLGRVAVRYERAAVR